MSKPLFFFKGEARFSKKTLENRPPFRVLKLFFFCGRRVSVLEEKNYLFFIRHSHPGQKESLDQPCAVSDERGDAERENERAKRERERETDAERLEKKKNKKEFESSI